MHDDTTLALEALSPKSTGNRRQAAPPPPVVEAPPTMNFVSLISHQAKDGSRIGFILVGPEPWAWLAAQRKRRPNTQCWKLQPEGAPPLACLAPSETEALMNELTRHRLWADGTYAGETQLVAKDSDAEIEAKFRIIRAANSARVYITGTLEVES